MTFRVVFNVFAVGLALPLLFLLVFHCFCMLLLCLFGLLCVFVCLFMLLRGNCCVFLPSPSRVLVDFIGFWLFFGTNWVVFFNFFCFLIFWVFCAKIDRLHLL